ncbi:MAG TPA: O-antigen ligase family protein [Usitatibacteraceae bacterium]|nr:O-antigen ligase family protein [Usitatibacteraceae bacterium]
MTSSGPVDAQPAWNRAVAGVLVAFLFVLPFSSNAALRNALLGFAAACVLYGSAKGMVARPRLPSWRVLAPILAYGAWSIASVAWSVEPAYSLSELRPGLLYPFIAFLAFFAATPSVAAIDRWAWSLSAGLAALGLVAGAELVLDGWWDPQRWHSDAGYYATHVVLALPLLAWAFLRAGTAFRGARVVLAAVAVLTLVVTSWNDNRIAWVALAAMTLLAVFLSRASLAGPLRSQVVAFTAAALIAFSALFVLSIQQRTTKLEHTEQAAEAQLSRDPRLAIWDHAARLNGEAPWIGHGYGRGILRQQFRNGVSPGVDNPLYTHAHNTPINVLLQGGAIGLGLFAWMVAALVREMAAGLKAGPPRRCAATLGLVLVAGFAIRNMTDDFLVRHSALLAWSLAGAILGALRPAPAPVVSGTASDTAGTATSARTPA